MPEGASIILNASTDPSRASQPSACMARPKLPCDRLPALDTTSKTARFGECGQPGMVPTPGYDLFGLSEEQLKEFVETKLTISRWDELARPTRSPKLLSFSLPMTAALSTASSCLWMAAWHKSKWVLCPERSANHSNSAFIGDCNALRYCRSRFCNH